MLLRAGCAAAAGAVAAAGTAAAAPAPAASAAAAAPMVTVGKVDGRLFDALRRRLRAGASASAGAHASARTARLVVVDGDHTSARRIRANRVIRTAADGERWVLVIDPTARVLSRAVRPMTGIGSARRHLAAAMFRRTLDRSGDPVVEVYRWQLKPHGPVGRAELRRYYRSVAATIVRAVRAGRPPADPRSARAAAEAQLPEGAQHARWIEHWVRSKWLDYCQTPGFAEDVTIDLFLENSVANPQGTRQWISVNVDGNAAPKEPKQEFCAWNDQERRWWTAAVQTGLKPESNQLALRSSAPSTPNDVTTYTSGNSFSFGMALSGRVGTNHKGTGGGVDGGVDFNWSTSHTRSHTLPKWAVRAVGIHNAPAWRFHANDPCNVDAPGISSAPGCFQVEGELIPSGKPQLPNAASRGSFDYHTSALWHTRSLVKSAVQITAETRLELMGFRCPEIFVVCTRRDVHNHWITGSERLTIDLPAVLPVRIASIAIDRGTTVRAGTPVTATVTLAAKAPTDLALPVSSDSPVVVPDDHVEFDKGRQTATFKALTRAGGSILDAGAVTAVLSVFYARPYNVALTVER